MADRTLINDGKWDIRPNPNGAGLNICVIEEKRGVLYSSLNLLWKIARIPFYLFLKRQE